MRGKQQAKIIRAIFSHSSKEKIFSTILGKILPLIETVIWERYWEASWETEAPIEVSSYGFLGILLEAPLGNDVQAFI